MIARLLHGFTDRLPSLRCCGKRWNDLPRHRSFAHGEEVVIPEQPVCDCGGPWYGGSHYPGCALTTVPCFCGAPAVGWTYSVSDDGISGIAVCAAHQEEQT